MSDLKNELETVRIKYLGQCPKERGHCHEGFSFIGGMILTTMFAMFFFTIILESWKEWGVKTGCGYYNQFGQFTWKDKK